MEIKNGGKYICNEIKNNLTEQVIGGQGKNPGFNSLSQREMEIISHLKKGDSSKEIADVLNISVKTVEVHRYNILRKLGLRNTASLVNYMNQHQPDL